jgi:uncharacterized RDD family membrane protein YckC
MDSHTPSVFEDLQPQLVHASRGKRFLNYIIDLIAFYLILIGLGILFVLLFPGFLEYSDNSSPMFNFLDRLVALILYGVIMGIFEAALKGKSIGKFITGTKAVNEDGSTISTKTAFLRGLSKAVPFCAFSALSGYVCSPWQDRWTKTYVINVKQSFYPEAAFEQEAS